MPYTLYDGSVAVTANALDSLKAILQKAQSTPNAPSLPESRIHPEMLDLSFQVFMVTDTAQKLVARTSGTEPLSLERNLKTFDDFYARIAQVQDVLSKADKALIDSRADALVPVGFGSKGTVQMPAATYVNGYVLPNIFFHLTTAYNICRKNGVDVGKMDFLTSFLPSDLIPK